MKVLVTGTTGFIGGAIAAHLLECKMEVIALDKRLTKINGLIKSIQADIGTESFMENITDEIESCETIIHAAATIDLDLYNANVSLTNCLGTQQLLHFAYIRKVKHFVFLSSVPVIGVPSQLPITEEHPINPRTAYHASKLFGEYLLNIASSKNLIGTVLRLTSPVGPGMPENRILPTFVKRALSNIPLELTGKGTRHQNYVDVRDIVKVLEKCLQKQINGIFNVAGKDYISNLKLAERCIQLLRSSSSINFKPFKDPEEGYIWDVSIKKAEELLEYCPQHTIDNTISTLGSEYAAGIH